jgi:hypothetical protein
LRFVRKFKYSQFANGCQIQGRSALRQFSHFTFYVKHFSVWKENVKQLPFLGEFRKKISLFPSSQQGFLLLVFGSDVYIGFHRGTHERSRCSNLATEPGNSPRTSDFHSCL